MGRVDDQEGRKAALFTQLARVRDLTQTGSETLDVSEPVSSTAGLGLEPRKPDPESGVMPFHHPARLTDFQRHAVVCQALMLVRISMRGAQCARNRAAWNATARRRSRG